MIETIAKLHIKALPHTFSSRRGVKFLTWLYKIVSIIGYVKTAKREGKVVGAISGIGSLVLTLIVDPTWQRKGIGRELLAGLKGRRFVYTEECTATFYEKVRFAKLIQVGKVVVLWRK